MYSQELLSSYKKQSDSRILLIVIDGLGGLRHPDYKNKSELEFARLPNLDSLTKHESTVLGIIYPVARGFIPGSAAGHFGLFGYDPLEKKHRIGRGILEVLDLGINVPLGSIVARINIATLDKGVVTDRRAKRADARPIINKLNDNLSFKNSSPFKNVKVEFFPSREHRGVILIQQNGHPLSPDITDTDPGEVDKPIKKCKPRDENDPVARKTADIVNYIVEKSLNIIQDDYPTNAILIRGFSQKPALPTFAALYGLEALAIADYPLYRGIAQLLGMTLKEPVSSLEDKVQQLRDQYKNHTFFYFHYKTPDSMGEDKNFMGKVKALEAFDQVIPDILKIMNLEKDVIVITGDHSTPSLIGAHTHHSVPLLLFSKQNKGYDTSEEFNEKEATHGTFGRIRAVELMVSLLARSGKLSKFDL